MRKIYFLMRRKNEKSKREVEEKFLHSLSGSGKLNEKI